MDTSEFQGDEADTYRDKVSDDLPPRLDTTSQAWQVVAAALKTYAGKLEDLQSRMATLKAKADDQVTRSIPRSRRLTSAQVGGQGPHPVAAGRGGEAEAG